MHVGVVLIYTQDERPNLRLRCFPTYQHFSRILERTSRVSNTPSVCECRLHNSACILMKHIEIERTSHKLWMNTSEFELILNMHRILRHRIGRTFASKILTLEIIHLIYRSNLSSLRIIIAIRLHLSMSLIEFFFHNQLASLVVFCI